MSEPGAPTPEVAEPAEPTGSIGSTGLQPAGVHLLGLLLAGVAALLLILALTALDWLSSGGLPTSHGYDSSLSTLRTLLRLEDDHLHQAHSRLLAKLFFTWGAWALLVLAVVGAAVGNVSAAAGRNGRVFGIVAIVFGLLGVAATFASIDLLRSVHGGPRVPAYTDYLHHVGPAFFCAVAGFLLAAFAGAAAARRPLPHGARTQPVSAAS